MIISEIKNVQIEVIDKMSFGYFTVDYKHEVKAIKGYIEIPDKLNMKEGEDKEW